MRRFLLLVVALGTSTVIAAAHSRSAVAAQADEVIALERAALDRWGKGDPKGFLEIYAPEVTYFDRAPSIASMATTPSLSTFAHSRGRSRSRATK